MSEPRIVTPQEDTATALVCAMREDEGSPVVIGNGSYGHASLLASHLAAVVDERIAAAERAAVVKALRSNNWRNPQFGQVADAIENGADL